MRGRLRCHCKSALIQLRHILRPAVRESSLDGLAAPKSPIEFTFLWLTDNRWEQRNYELKVQARTKTQMKGAAYGEHVA